MELLITGINLLGPKLALQIQALLHDRFLLRLVQIGLDCFAGHGHFLEGFLGKVFALLDATFDYRHVAAVALMFVLLM